MYPQSHLLARNMSVFVPHLDLCKESYLTGRGALNEGRDGGSIARRHPEPLIEEYLSSSDDVWLKKVRFGCQN